MTACRNQGQDQAANVSMDERQFHGVPLLSEELISLGKLNQFFQGCALWEGTHAFGHDFILMHIPVVVCRFSGLKQWTHSLEEKVCVAGNRGSIGWKGILLKQICMNEFPNNKKSMCLLDKRNFFEKVDHNGFKRKYVQQV